MKKLLTLMLTICIFLTSTLPVFAFEADTDLSNDIQEIILRVLSSIEFEKEEYGLENVDFSSVLIGEKIPTYEVQEGQLVEFPRLIFPLIANDTMVSQIFAVQNESNGEWYIQLDNTLVDETIKNVGSNSFAYIYDDYGVYTYSNGEIKLVGIAEDIGDVNELEQNIEGRHAVENQASNYSESNYNLINSLSENDFISINCSPVEVKTVINVHSYLEGIPTVYAGATSAYLPVQKIKQPINTNICWAIAITSIANYIYKTDHHYNQIVQWFTLGVDKGQTIQQVISNFNQFFSAGYAVGGAHPAPKKIVNQLSAGYPVYGSFSSSNGSHAVVIRGCDKSNKTFSVMNPNPNTNSYTAGSISSTKVWTFVSAYSKKTYTMANHGFHQ